MEVLTNRCRCCAHLSYRNSHNNSGVPTAGLKCTREDAHWCKNETAWGYELQQSKLVIVLFTELSVYHFLGSDCQILHYVRSFRPYASLEHEDISASLAVRLLVVFHYGQGKLWKCY